MRPASRAGLEPARLQELIRAHATLNPWSPPPVNVLEVNLALEHGFGPVGR
jgi:K+-transporting ATPase c subunit